MNVYQNNKAKNVKLYFVVARFRSEIYQATSVRGCAVLKQSADRLLLFSLTARSQSLDTLGFSFLNGVLPLDWVELIML